MDKDFAKTLKDLLKKWNQEPNVERFECEQLGHKVVDTPFRCYQTPIDPALANFFGGKSISMSGGDVPQKFQAKSGFLYHGTSTAALDAILESGMMYPAAYLLVNDKLVSGELRRTGTKGPKFLSRQAMIERGMLKIDDPHHYEFGHAGDVVFGSHPLVAAGYLPEDPEQRVIIGLDLKVLEIYGAKFIDAKSEGILHEGELSIRFGLKQLLVPDIRVDEYKARTKDGYLVTVFPLSDFQSNAKNAQSPTTNKP